MKRWALAVALVGFLAPSLAAAADDYPSRPIRAIASQGPGRLERPVHARTRRPDGTGAWYRDRGRGPRRCRRHRRRQSLRRRGGGRLHDLHPSRPDFCHQPVPSWSGFRSDEGLGAGGAALLSDADVRDQRVARSQILCRTRGAGKIQAGYIQLHRGLRCRRSRSWKTSTSRMAPTSSAYRSRVAAMPSTACSTARRRSHFSASAIWCRSSKTAKSPVLRSMATRARRWHPTFRRSRKLGYTEHIGATFFGIFAPTGTPTPIIDKLNKAIVAVESKPDFQQKFLINRGLTPCWKSAEQFAKELPADRAEGLSVVKSSGLYPDVK